MSVPRPPPQGQGAQETPTHQTEQGVGPVVSASRPFAPLRVSLKSLTSFPWPWLLLRLRMRER